MGHRLPYHETCKNVHGHSYRMVVEVTGDLDDGGMVIDYGIISDVVKPIVAQLDHSFMVDPWDDLMREVLDSSGLKTTEVEFYSTAENIAQWVLGQISASLFASPNVCSVTTRVFETAGSMAQSTSVRS